MNEFENLRNEAEKINSLINLFTIFSVAMVFLFVVVTFLSLYYSLDSTWLLGVIVCQGFVFAFTARRLIISVEKIIAKMEKITKSDAYE